MSSARLQLPTRFVVPSNAPANVSSTRLQRIGQFLNQGDPLADAAVLSLASKDRNQAHELIDTALQPGAQPRRQAAVPKALRQLVEQASEVPFWADQSRAERGGAAIIKVVRRADWCLRSAR